MAKPEDSSFSGHTSHRRRPLFAVGVEVGTVIPPDIRAAVGGSVGWSHTLQEVSLLTVSLNPCLRGAIHYVSRPVTKGQRLQRAVPS